MKIPPDLRREAKQALKLGWTIVTAAGSGHLKWYDPDGVLRLITAATPSKGRRGMQNAKANLKKWGITA